MARLLDDWLPAFRLYAQHTEAPGYMHFWSGVSAIAGALRRKVWMDQYYFKWTPNFFIIFVAPPGIVAKSTTADLGLDLLRDVPGIKFGPDIVTWQSLVTSFANASESFQYPPDSGDWHPMSPLTLVASEMGNLINPQDKEMVNLFINLWDGRKKLEKQTKMSGSDLVEAPWINMIACTTPSWIAENIPQSMIGGGLASRCVWVYGEEKEKFVAYPKYHVPKGISDVRKALVHDLEHISLNLCGEYELSPAARAWGERWYEALWKGARERYSDDQREGYIARKQTHLHKLAMVLAASARDELVLTMEDLQSAEVMLSELEEDMPKVFSRIGRTDISLQAERFISTIDRKGKVEYAEAYRLVHAYFADFRDYEGVLNGAIRSGQIKVSQGSDGKFYLSTPKADDSAHTLSANNTHTQSPLPGVNTETNAPNS